MSDQNNFPNIDRRTAKRQKSKFTMLYTVMEQEDRSPQETTTVDISSKSVLFEETRMLSIGTEIGIELKVPSLVKPVKAEGRIIRVEEKERESHYYYCMLFDKITEEDQQCLETYIQLIDVESLLRLAVEQNASDVHLVADNPPVFRIEGALKPLEGFPALSSEDLKQTVMAMMTEKQKSDFWKNMELNFSCLLPDGVRFRANVHLEKGNLEAALRIIPSEIKSFADLGLPPEMEELAKRQKGLIIITGPTGSGKTTTLSALVDAINKNRNCMVISVEDPIEYVHQNKQSIIKQREVGRDTLSFNNALKHVLRQDPDVILVGELRDLESISMAITAAENGRLVLTTMHTSDTVECIKRLVDVFPAEKQEQVRRQLAGCLEAVLAQLLLPRKDGKGRALATEFLVATPTIKNLIRDGKLGQLPNYMEAGLQFGMHQLDNSIKELVKKDLVDDGLARGFAKNPSSIITPGQLIPTV